MNINGWKLDERWLTARRFIAVSFDANSLQAVFSTSKQRILVCAKRRERRPSRKLRATEPPKYQVLVVVCVQLIVVFMYNLAFCFQCDPTAARALRRPSRRSANRACP